MNKVKYYLECNVNFKKHWILSGRENTVLSKADSFGNTSSYCRIDGAWYNCRFDVQSTRIEITEEEAKKIILVEKLLR
jgi:hypothetical protein